MLLRRFLRSRDGGVAPMLALAALPLFGFAGAAVDFSRAASARTAMQAALDSSALILAKAASNVAAYQLAANGSDYFNANFQNSEVQNIQLTTSTSSTSSGYSVSMSATGTMKTNFMGMMGFGFINISVRSNAMSSTDGLGCVLSLNAHGSGAITFQGSASVVLNGCSLYDNSDNTAALVAGGSAQVTALSVGVVGNLSGASNITTTQGIRTGIGAVADPYVNAYFPAFGGCTEQNFNAKDTVTLNPGVYCGGMNINGNAKVTLSPGIYYLDGGDLSVNGGGTLVGSGVTLVFTSQNKTGFASASINGNANIELTPPTTGPTAGIVMFGDRRIPSGTPFKFNGGATQYFGGAIYLPTAAVDFSGGSGTSMSCTQLIADTITFTGNSAIALNCNNYGTKPFSPLIVKLLS
jgi:Flp pilus assembly protein TadG